MLEYKRYIDIYSYHERSISRYIKLFTNIDEPNMKLLEDDSIKSECSNTISEYSNTILEYKYNINITNNKNNNISIYNEILRENIIINLIKIFNNNINKFKVIINKNIFYKIFKYNKFNELVQRWCWSQYYNNTSIDNVIPYVTNNIYDYDDFIDNFNYILHTNINEKNNIIVSLKNNVIDYLKNSYKTYINLLNKNEDIKLIIDKSKKDTIIFKVSHNNNEIKREIFNAWKWRNNCFLL